MLRPTFIVFVKLQNHHIDFENPMNFSTVLENVLVKIAVNLKRRRFFPSIMAILLIFSIYTNLKYSAT